MAEIVFVNKGRFINEVIRISDAVEFITISKTEREREREREHYLWLEISRIFFVFLNQICFLIFTH